MTKEQEQKPAGSSQKKSQTSIDSAALVEAVNKASFLLTPQKEALLRLIQSICSSDESHDHKMEAYEHFVEAVEEYIDNPHSSREDVGAEMLVRTVLRRLLETDIEFLGTAERREIDLIFQDLGIDRHMVDTEPIGEALKSLEEKLENIGSEQQED